MFSTVFEHSRAVSSTWKNIRALDCISCSKNFFLRAGNNPVVIKNSTEHAEPLFIALLSSVTDLVKQIQRRYRLMSLSRKTVELCCFKGKHVWSLPSPLNSSVKDMITYPKWIVVLSAEKIFLLQVYLNFHDHSCSRFDFLSYLYIHKSNAYLDFYRSHI